MKSFFFATFILLRALSFAQVGIGTTTPDASAVLELSSTNKGFLPPRVQLTGTSDVSTIASPATGLMVYNLVAAGSGTTAVASGFYFFDGAKWQRFISQQPDVTVEFSTTNPNSGSPTFLPDTPASTDYIYVSTVDGSQWTWNGTTYVSFTAPSANPWYLGGSTNDAAGNKTSSVYRSGSVAIGSATTPNASAMLDLSSSSKGFLPPRMTKTQRDAIVSPEAGLVIFCTNCASSGSGCLAQNIGTSTVPNWECVGATAPPSVSATCNGFVTGTYINGIAVNGTYTVTFINNTFATVSVAFATADLVLSGVSGITVSAVSPASANLIAGATQVVTYTISGTPTATGTLTGTWTKLTLNCSSTKNVSLGGATFSSSMNSYVFSVNDVTMTPNVVFQGTLAIGTTIQMPYTSGLGTYTAYTSPFVSISSQYCEDGASDWTFGYSYSAGTFATSGNITVTLITRKAGVITAWNAKRVTSVSTINFSCVTAPWSVNGTSYTSTVGLDEGGDAIRGALAQGGCASCVAYDAAAVNSWIGVTSAEYIKLALISNASKSVATDVFMAQTPANIYAANVTISQDASQVKVPASSYIYALRFKCGNVTGVAITGSKLKVASAITGTYTTVASAITTSAVTTPYTNYYFVLKRPTYQTIASSQFAAIYVVGSGTIGIVSGGSNYTGGGDVASISSAGSYFPYFQLISTTVKQW